MPESLFDPHLIEEQQDFVSHIAYLKENAPTEQLGEWQELAEVLSQLQHHLLMVEDKYGDQPFKQREAAWAVFDLPANPAPSDADITARYHELMVLLRPQDYDPSQILNGQQQRVLDALKEARRVLTRYYNVAFAPGSDYYSLPKSAGAQPLTAEDVVRSPFATRSDPASRAVHRSAWMTTLDSPPENAPSAENMPVLTVSQAHDIITGRQRQTEELTDLLAALQVLIEQDALIELGVEQQLYPRPLLNTITKLRDARDYTSWSAALRDIPDAYDLRDRLTYLVPEPTAKPGELSKIIPDTETAPPPETTTEALTKLESAQSIAEILACLTILISADYKLVNNQGKERNLKVIKHNLEEAAVIQNTISASLNESDLLSDSTRANITALADRLAHVTREYDMRQVATQELLAPLFQQSHNEQVLLALIMALETFASELFLFDNQFRAMDAKSVASLIPGYNATLTEKQRLYGQMPIAFDLRTKLLNSLQPGA